MRKQHTAEQKAKTSRAMKRYWAHRRQRDARAAVKQSMELSRAIRAHDTDMIEIVPKHVKAFDTVIRFPFASYESVLGECQAIVHDRDQQARNAYAPFFAQFPHGVQDVTFELHRRVARVLGAEKAVLNGHHGAFNDPQAQALTTTMRGDLVDLVNYAAFAVLLLDQATQA